MKFPWHGWWWIATTACSHCKQQIGQRLRMGEHRIVWRIQLQVVPAVVPGPGNGAREQIAGRLATADVGLGAARQWTFQTDRLEVTVWRLALQARIHPSLVGEGYPEL